MTSISPTRTVVLTDFAWPDDQIEREIIESAGFKLISGPANPAPSAIIEALITEHQPDAILTCWAQVSAAAINASKALKVVARLGVGLDNIAVEQATNNSVWVTNVPDYCVEEVSDHAVGLTLAWTRGLVSFDREVQQGRWSPSGAKLRRLRTLTVGIIGYGRIGRRTAEKFKAFNCRILVSDPCTVNESGVEQVGLDELMRQADVVIVHAPLNAKTHHLISHAQLALLKPGSFLLNVSRGAVVNSAAVIAALDNGQLSGAGLDVLESEPQVPQELLNHPGVIITPHVAFSSDASLIELRQRASQEVVRVLLGDHPEQPCNQITQ